MMKRYREELEISERLLSLEEFLKAYNQNIPDSFPRASAKKLKKFQDEYPTLFKGGKIWSIAIHRKKIMDWLPGQQKSS